jgi:DNA-binding MarR family transcriptional regulator
MEQIAEKTNSSFRSVRYWQGKLKIKRSKITIEEKIIPLLKINPNITPNEISEILGVRNTSVHAVLRKMKSKNC